MTAVEISTDKVDAEIPRRLRRSSGNQSFRRQHGKVNTVVGTISADGEAAAPARRNCGVSRARRFIAAPAALA